MNENITLFREKFFIPIFVSNIYLHQVFKGNVPVFLINFTYLKAFKRKDDKNTFTCTENKMFHMTMRPI